MSMKNPYDFVVPLDRKPIALVDGCTYLNGLDEPKVIVDTPYGFPDYCYSSDGDWFERATGSFVGYNWDTGEDFAPQPPSWADIYSRASDTQQD